MKYELNLEVRENKPEKFYKIIQSEQGKKDRSELSAEKGEKSVIFNIKAADATALKASFNRVLKTLVIYEKTQDLIKND
ncbi:hypothetical protein GF323_03975 [Candidatus Woesearchaeota archaeon]|nr:hypothetical protein [Candidatus Woesearchaeota archaeon]